ncbi:MAG: chorismate synthase [Pseudomonadota bacterium]
MSSNRFGHHFSCLSWGESHGPAIGCVLDGVPAGMALDEGDIQPWLDQRRPGQSRFVTQRREADQIQILSGVFEGRTTGTPIAMMIENTDQRSRDYGQIADQFRPGHADYTYWAKYGLRDYRGGGRASAREMAMRVAAGAVARKILQHFLPDPLTIEAVLIEVGGHRAEAAFDGDWRARQDNPFWCPDPKAVQGWEILLDQTRKDGDSLGSMLWLRARGVPAGLGQPLYRKMDAELAAALMSMNAVKSVEIGAGQNAARLPGSINGDQIYPGQVGGIRFASNHAGGILGGITSGQDVTATIAIKPASSILKPMASIDRYGNAVTVQTRGRHDPCVGIRAVPVAEAMMACVLVDALCMHMAQMGHLPPLAFQPDR